MNDEVAHLRIVHGLLRLRAPGRIGGRVIRVDADDVYFGQILEFDVVDARQLAAEHEMKKLFVRGPDRT